MSTFKPVTQARDFGLRLENSQLSARIEELQNNVTERDVRIVALESRITELEKLNAALVDQNSSLTDENNDLMLHVKSLSSRLSLQATSPTFSPKASQQSYELPLRPIGAFPTNYHSSEFDHDLMQVEESSPMAPVFVNSNESAVALLRKIESAAREPFHFVPSFCEEGESEVIHNSELTVEPSPRRSISKASISEFVTTTPARAIATPSGFFSRSFSAIKSRFGFGTPIPQSSQNSQATSPEPSTLKALPPSDTFTETLSLPPTPIGERTMTSSKKKKTNTILKTLLRGVETNDKLKAEEWAKNILPKLKNDPSFREKRRRLETPVLVKDLDNFPSSKPWETGFGDPLGDMDDEDVVPVWAVYLDLVAAEEEHAHKKRKAVHDADTDDDDIVSINEQYAASNGATPTSKLYDSQGHSTSLLDLHPRRSVEPSPFFDTPVSHNQGANVFSELQGHDTTAKQRAKDRELLKTPSKAASHSHNPTMGSFSVPDESDEEDSGVDMEASDATGAPLWTQPPPPAPVPAHAPLPGGPVVDAPTVPVVQQPVDEVERQRQKLMKHTPAKPSRLREATYPSPSLLSDAGNELMSTPTPAYLTASMAHIFADMPDAQHIVLNEEEEGAVDAYLQQQMLNNPWGEPIVTYDSDEEDVSPI